MIHVKTIGSDPEYVMVNNLDSVIQPYDIFNRRRLIECGKSQICDRTDMCTVSNHYCYHNNQSPQIGTDGFLGELRPLPGNTPSEHLSNIRELVHLLDLPEGYETYGGTRQYGMSIGGHIHIGMNIQDSDKHVLSNYLSYYAGIPLRKIEILDDLTYRGLRENGFGKYGSYDIKPYGIEWRMPASWLINPEIALFSLSLAYVVANEFAINPENKSFLFTKHRGLIHGDVSEIINKIEKMDIYPLYRKEIEPLFQMIVNRETWNPYVSFLDQW